MQAVQDSPPASSSHCSLRFYHVMRAGRAEVQLITLGGLLQLEGKGENLRDINMVEFVTHRIEGSGYPPYHSGFCYIGRKMDKAVPVPKKRIKKEMRQLCTNQLAQVTLRIGETLTQSAPSP